MSLPTLVFEAGSLTSLGIAHMVCQLTNGSQEPTCLCFSSTGVMSMHHHCAHFFFFHGFWGIELSSSYLHSKHFTN